MKNIMLDSNYTNEDKRKYFLGEIAYTILNKELFTRNSDLKVYIAIFENIQNINEYKDYLYKSRTLLVSRILKDVKNNLSNTQFDKLVKQHYKFFDKKHSGSESNKKETINKVNSNSILNNYLKAKSRNK